MPIPAISAPGAPLYSPCNWIAEASLVEASDPDDQFPAAYLSDSRPGTVGKLASTTGHFKATFTSPRTPTFCALPNHGFAPDSVVVLYSSPDDVAWTVQQVIPMTGAVAGGSNNNWTSWPIGSAQTATYWRLSILVAGTGVPNVRIGEWWLGEAVDLGRGWAWGSSQGPSYTVRGGESELGVPAKYSLAQRRRWLGQTRGAMDQTQRDALVALAEATRGSARPVLWVPYSDLAYGCAIARPREDEVNSAALAPDTYGGLPMNFIEDLYARTTL